MPAADAALAFVAAINSDCPEAVSACMTDDHVFTDSLGNRVEGKAKMTAAWAAYFRMVPDYSIAIAETLADGDIVVLLGTAQGTYTADGQLRPENRWSTPAALRARVRGSLIAEWQVYADNDPIRQIMARGK